MQFQFPTHFENQAPMSAYMQNKFQFVGVKSTERRLLSRSLLTESRDWSLTELLQTCQQLYALTAREYQYLAIDLAERNVKRLDQATYGALVQLSAQKAWWDSIDAWRKVFGIYIRQHQSLATDGQWFLAQEDFWNRRIGITLQLTWHAAVDVDFLTTAIQQNLTDQEFFIQKGIGWALRDYSKDDPTWVRSFIAKTPQLSSLARREGLKWLKNHPDRN